jgi:hypothetical protein
MMTKSATRLYRVGDRVRIPFGSHAMLATVIEDRGMFGTPREQVVRVSAVFQDEPEEFEVSARLVQLVRRARQPARSANRAPRAAARKHA